LISFLKTFSRSDVKPRIHRTKKVSFDPETLKGWLDYTVDLDTLYAVDNRFDFLQQRDIIAVANSARESGASDRLLQIRHIQKGPLLEYLKYQHGDHRIRTAAKRQIGREIADDEHLTILEVATTFRTEWEGQEE